MDIKIEAPGHKQQEGLKEFYLERLTKKFGDYKFIHAIDVKVKLDSEKKVQVSLQLKPEKGKMLYVTDHSTKENIALNNAIRKMNVLIEKYKEKHYRSVHNVIKNK